MVFSSSTWMAIFIEVADRVKAIAPISATGTLIRMKHSVLISIAHGRSVNAKSFSSLAYRKQFLHGCKYKEEYSYLQETSLYFIIFYMFKHTVNLPAPGL